MTTLLSIILATVVSAISKQWFQAIFGMRAGAAISLLLFIVIFYVCYRVLKNVKDGMK